MRLAVLGVAALLSVGVAGANAEFVDHGTYSTDSNTGLDWLDLTQTSGTTFSAINDGSGGWVNNGWRYATGSELSYLFTTYVGSGPENGYQGSPYQNALSLVHQLGVIFSFNNSEGIRQVYEPNGPTQITVVGRFDDGNPNNLVGIGELTAQMSYSNIATESSRWVVYNDWSPDNNLPVFYGNFLVRVTAAVPEPSTWAMMILGFAGVGYMTYRRGKQSTAHSAA